MACRKCATQFSLFQREKGCHNCGYAFCKNCLQKRAKVPKHANKVSVCDNCYDKLTNRSTPSSSNSDPRKYSPPANFVKRMEALEAREGELPATRSKAVPSRKVLNKDQEIANRLQKLKQPAKDIPSEKEIANRLDRLKDVDPAARFSRPSYQAPDRRTQIEQAGDLYKEMQEEVKIDNRPYDEMEERLAALHEGQQRRQHEEIDAEKIVASQKDKGPVKGEMKDVFSEEVKEPSAEEVLHLIEKAKQESSLELEDKKRSDEKDAEIWEKLEKLKRYNRELAEKNTRTSQVTKAGGSGTPVHAVEEEDDEELPWCCICNADATISCDDCDGDLYCRRCYKEGHDQYGYKNHRSKPFKPNKHE